MANHVLLFFMICFALTVFGYHLLRILHERWRSFKERLGDGVDRTMVGYPEDESFENRYGCRLPARLIDMYRDRDLVTSRHLYFEPPGGGGPPGGWYIWQFRMLDETALDAFPAGAFQSEFPFATDAFGHVYTVETGNETMEDSPVCYWTLDSGYPVERIMVAPNLEQFLSWKRVRFFPRHERRSHRPSEILLEGGERAPLGWPGYYWFNIESGEVEWTALLPHQSYERMVRYAGGYSAYVMIGYKRMFVALYTDERRLFLRVGEKLFDLSDVNVAVDLTSSTYDSETRSNRFSVDRNGENLLALSFNQSVQWDEEPLDIFLRVYLDTKDESARMKILERYRNRLAFGTDFEPSWAA